MENEVKTPPKTPIDQSENTHFDSKLPPQTQHTDHKSQNSGNDSPMPATTPDRLKVPKAFKYPERYTSPTDLMMSPISKGLLARSRKPGAGGLLLPPTINQSKQIQDLIFQEVGLSQT